jgi:hypothetical protein
VSGADGVYSFAAFPPANPANTLTFLSLVADTFGGFFNLSTQDQGLLGDLTATVQGGRVTSIDGLIIDGIESWTFAGPAVSFATSPPMVLSFSGQAAMVPEPGVYALMIAGLAAGVWARRRTKRSP